MTQRITSLDSDSDYFRYPVGSPEHYAAYAKEFGANHGIGYVYPDNPAASYVVDHAYELAYLAEEHAGDPDAGPEAEQDTRGKGPLGSLPGRRGQLDSRPGS